MISLVICTYNRSKYIYTTLERIAHGNFAQDSYEILLVNNNSTDDTESECLRFKAAWPDVPYHYMIETKQGLSHARNRGIEEARGEWVVFLDDDAFVGPDYLQKLSAYIEAYPDMAAFGGRIDPLFESGETPRWLSKWSYSWVSAIDKGDKVCLFEGNQYPIGANMGINKATLNRVGLFNTQLGRTKKNMMGGEEKDIFNRIKADGSKIYYLPDIKVQHVIPPQRTTDEYISRLGDGTGTSERVRTKTISQTTYLKRLLSEAIKWGGTIVLALNYTLHGQNEKGRVLILFRRHVTRGLLGKASV